MSETMTLKEMLRAAREFEIHLWAGEAPEPAGTIRMPPIVTRPMEEMAESIIRRCAEVAHDEDCPAHFDCPSRIARTILRDAGLKE